MDQSFPWLTITGGWQHVAFLICAVAFITQQSHGEDEDLQTSCESPQFSEIGKGGLISCVFAQTTSQVFWYKNLNGNSSFLASSGSQAKSVDGYTSEEYDIAENGSLIIRNVSLNHDGNYEVMSLDASDRTSTFTVYLIITGSTKGQHPHIDACDHEPFCLTEYEENNNITCSFDTINPPPKLEWLRLYYGGKEVVNSVEFLQTDSSFKPLTTATVSMANLPKRMLHFLSCEATWPSSRSMTLSATVVVDNTKEILSYNEANVMTKVLMENAHHKFLCGNMDSSLISVWKKKRKESDDYHTFAYSYFDRSRYKFSRSLLHYVIPSGDTLTFQPIRRKNEGIYYCLTSNGLKDLYAFFRIDVQSNESPACMTPQYSQIGTRGYILCNFPLKVSAVYWYYEQGGQSSIRLISREKKTEKWKTVKDNEDYDISTNGSLIIERVKIQSEGNYIVTFLSSRDEVFTFHVTLIATVPPVQQHPLVNVCDGDKLCFTEYKREKVLICRLDNVKPSAVLMWYTQVSLDKEGSVHSALTWSETTKLSEANELATFSTISALPMSALPENDLQVLFCKATWPSPDSQPLLTKVIVDNFSGPLSFYESNIISVDLIEGSNKKLVCRRHLKETDSIFLWKFSPNYTRFEFHDLAYTYFDRNGGYIASSTSVSILKNLLFFSSADRRHNGIYICIASNGNSQLTTFYNVTVLKPPTPRYIIVEQCGTEYGLCQLSASQGVLSCYVFNVYPVVQLEIISDDSSLVKLSNIKRFVNENFDSFNVSVQAEYDAEITSVGGSVTLYCRASGKATAAFNKEREIFVKLPETSEVTNPPADEPLPSKISWKLIPVVVFVSAFVVVVTVIFHFSKNREKKKEEKEEKGKTSENKRTPSTSDYPGGH